MGSGQADELTITALDEFAEHGNELRRRGWRNQEPHLRRRGRLAQRHRTDGHKRSRRPPSNSAQATAIKFVNGKASVSGADNGVLTLYKVEEAHIKVKEGTLNNGTGLAMKVKAGEAKGFKLSAPAPAEPEVGQAFNVTLTALDAGGNIATTYGGAGRPEQDDRLLRPSSLAVRDECPNIRHRPRP